MTRSWKRRDLLRLAALGGAATLGVSSWSRRGGAVTFGDVPSGSESSMLPESFRARNVLECFLSGGFNPWDSFYARPGLGEVDGTFAYAAYDHLIRASEGCGFEGAGPDPFRYFAKDSAQQEIFFGPYLAKLLARPDVMKRLRVVVNRHTEVVHENASALMTTGRVVGHPAAAGLASHVSRFFVDRGSSAGQSAPVSYTFAGPSGFTFTAPIPVGSVALGAHPSRARPVSLNLENLARLRQLWARPTVGSAAERERFDELVSAYFQQYRARLRTRGEGELVRASGFLDLESALSRQTQSAVFSDVVLQGGTSPWMTEPMCREVQTDSQGQPVLSSSTGQTTPGAAGNLPAMGLKLATHLLTHPTSPARYCSVTDAGIRQADGGGGYDCHSDGPWRQAVNLNNLLEHLLSFINAPGENDARKLSLDETLIILNTEFGRSPGLARQGSLGRAHWPSGFVQIYIGGPIKNGQAGCHGHIDETGRAAVFATPAENRIAALLALGIYPFDGDGAAFSPADVVGQTEATAAIRSVQRRFFGV